MVVEVIVYFFRDFSVVVVDVGVRGELECFYVI